MQGETKTHKIHRDKHKWIYAQWNGPSVTKPNPENCKNCLSKCAYDCAQLQYTVQHRTVLIISTLTSTQTSQLRCCLSEERGHFSSFERLDEKPRWLCLVTKAERKPSIFGWFVMHGLSSYSTEGRTQNFGLKGQLSAQYTGDLFVITQFLVTERTSKTMLHCKSSAYHQKCFRRSCIWAMLTRRAMAQQGGPWPHTLP